ncbi:MAG: GTP 3',8-cyclase MoaA [Candidatus Metalachnospira sp.]|nr:GTP 3',8-cyclase MoaA [Bacteroidaceae bacterium]MEA4971647.1 GTP 3',8-cyclase MoaA [Candidatus Metalachnospira sp.]
MWDSYGRKIEYSRISITDRCNLRCSYCMPDGIKCVPMNEILTFEEIAEICSMAAELGIKYIRLTGGEPLVRLGCEKLIKMIKDIKGIERVSITTNGILLNDKIEGLIEAGLDGVNISLDTLDSEKFRCITGFYGLERVLSAIDESYSRGISVKINTVLLKENINEYEKILMFAKDRNIAVRFIEMMPIGEGIRFPSVDCNSILNIIKKRYPDMKPVDSNIGAGPAVYYEIPGFEGKIGFINAVHGKFCNTCNRVRLTSKGFLKACLCYDMGTDLKKIVRYGNKSSLRSEMERVILDKPKEHCFNIMADITEKNKMSEIGG